METNAFANVSKDEIISGALKEIVDDPENVYLKEMYRLLETDYQFTVNDIDIWYSLYFLEQKNNLIDPEYRHQVETCFVPYINAKRDDLVFFQ